MYRTVTQIESLNGQLAGSFPDLCTRLELPEPSVRGRGISALRLRAGDSAGRPGVLIVAGIHARELMNCDLLVEIAVDLVTSYVSGSDVVLGQRMWPAHDVRLMLEGLDIYLLPCANPDGRDYVMTVDDMWRKNRRDNPASPCDGVDVNRNADLLWGVTEGQTSCSACAEVFAGSAPFSEPETRNVKHLLDSHRVDCMLDVHSYGELVLYPWGHAPNQTTDPSQRFTQLPTGTCRPLADPDYEEFISEADLRHFRTLAQQIVEAIADVRRRTYTPQPGLGLYPTTGTLSDYAYSRHISDPAVRKVYGFTLETGPWAGSAPESFHPADPEPVKREAESGLFALLQQCATGRAVR